MGRKWEEQSKRGGTVFQAQRLIEPYKVIILTIHIYILGIHTFRIKSTMYICIF